MNCFRSLYLWVDLQRRLSGHPNHTVVNCFRSLYLWVDLQPLGDPKDTHTGCELLSFFVPLGWFTAGTNSSNSIPRLWIAFVLCTFGLIYSWFKMMKNYIGLWIAFVLCTFGLIYSHSIVRELSPRVVNCFRSLYLWVDLQPGNWRVTLPLVVNCFRSLYLWVDLQLGAEVISVLVGCELLSFFVPLGWFTAGNLAAPKSIWLWIAFVLCTFGLIYSANGIQYHQRQVVNCFRSLYLWVDLQQAI